MGHFTDIQEKRERVKCLGRGSISHSCSTWLFGMETSRGILEGKRESEGEREQRKVVGMSEGRQTH